MSGMFFFETVRSLIARSYSDVDIVLFRSVTLCLLWNFYR